MDNQHNNSFTSTQRSHVWVLVLCLVTTWSYAQTVRPLIDENILKAAGKVARGKIEYTNDSLQPLTVTIDVKGFTVNEIGGISYHDLDPAIRVKLSAMSFRVDPQQTYTVWYEASADQLPAWFVIYASFAGFRERTQQGFKLQVQLPHTVYLLSKQSVQKNELTIVNSEYSSQDKKVIVRVRNSGPAFTRVLEAKVSGTHTHSDNGGFPLFPQAERQVEIPWTNDAAPDKIELRLERFSLEQSVEKR